MAMFAASLLVDGKVANMAIQPTPTTAEGRFVDAARKKGFRRGDPYFQDPEFAKLGVSHRHCLIFPSQRNSRFGICIFGSDVIRSCLRNQKLRNICLVLGGLLSPSAKLETFSKSDYLRVHV